MRSSQVQNNTDGENAPLTSHLNCNARAAPLMVTFYQSSGLSCQQLLSTPLKWQCKWLPRQTTARRLTYARGWYFSNCPFQSPYAMLMLTGVALNVFVFFTKITTTDMKRIACHVLNIGLYLKRRAPTGQSFGAISILSLWDLLPQLAPAQFRHQLLSYCGVARSACRDATRHVNRKFAWWRWQSIHSPGPRWIRRMALKFYEWGKFTPKVPFFLFCF